MDNSSSSSSRDMDAENARLVRECAALTQRVAALEMEVAALKANRALRDTLLHQVTATLQDMRAQCEQTLAAPRTW